MKTVTTKEHYWKLRDKCNQGKHKLRDNNLGVTWCVVCGFQSLKPCGTPLTEEEKLLINMRRVDNWKYVSYRLFEIAVKRNKTEK